MSAPALPRSSTEPRPGREPQPNPRGVSAVVPAHNGLPDVLEAVESALGQSLPPAEVLVIDDRSTDGTAEAVERRFGDAVRVIRGRFGSAAAARNAGWKHASSPWIAFLDADDFWFSDKLASAAATLEAVPSAGWFFSDGTFRTLEGEVHPSWLVLYADLPEPYAGSPLEPLLDVNFVLTSSVVVRRDLLEALGGFDETLSHAEDLDLWIKLSRRVPATAARKALVRYQHRPGGLTRQVEARLNGDVELFERLAADRTLASRLRRRARRRAALAHLKLAFGDLREGRGSRARAHLREAWLFPDRALTVTGAWIASLLPFGLLQRLRGPSAARDYAASSLRQDRVTLRNDPQLPGIGGGGRP